MPRSVFSASSLRAAAPGLGVLAQAIGGGGQAFEQARQGEVSFQSKLAQALASVDAHNASAMANRAKAAQDEQETGIMAGRAGVGDELLAATVGTDVPTVKAWRNGLQTGRPEMTSQNGGEDLATGIPQAPMVSSAIAKLLGERAAEFAPYRTNTKDMKPDDLAQARSIDRTSRLSDAIIAGTANRNTVGGAQAAAAGKDLFKTDTSGAVLDQFGGQLDTNNPMAGSTINLRKEQAGAQKANAAQSYAQAGAAKALAEQRQQVTKNGPAPGRVPVGYRYITDENGELKLEPIPGGPKDPNAQTGKPLPASASKGYLENVNALRTVQDALKLIGGEDVGEQQGDAQATGFKGYLPNVILSRTDPKGVAARAAIADIGSLKIHDRSGAAVTAAETPRLLPFIPQATDSPEVVTKKLKQFEHNYRALLEESEEFYRSSGYNLPIVQSRKAAQPAAGAPAAAPAAPSASGWSIKKVP
jgi:hypothetical protein